MGVSGHEWHNVREWPTAEQLRAVDRAEACRTAWANGELTFDEAVAVLTAIAPHEDQRAIEHYLRSWLRAVVTPRENVS